MEHEFAKQTGYGIHMCSFEGAWTWVRGGQAREIRKDMRSKVTELQPELEMQGLFVQAADCRVRVDDENHSLDLRVCIPEKQTDALFEMKWTRQSLDVSLATGQAVIQVDEKGLPKRKVGFEDRESRQANPSECSGGYSCGAEGLESRSKVLARIMVPCLFLQ